MKVKIGDQMFDSENEAIMIILSPEDKNNISSMAPEATKYCSYPEGCYTEEEIKCFMTVVQP